MKRSRTGQAVPKATSQDGNRAGRTTSPNADLTSASDSNNLQEPASVPKNIQYANVIKRHHEEIRSLVTSHRKQAEGGENASLTRPSSMIGIDPADWAAWKSATAGNNKQAMADYADAMHRLATECWDHTSSSASGRPESAVEASSSTVSNPGDSLVLANPVKYDDRIAYVIHKLQDYFFGSFLDERGNKADEPSPKITSSSSRAVPGIINGLVKDRRRSYFLEHKMQMPLEDVSCLPAMVLREQLQKERAGFSSISTVGRIVLCRERPPSDHATLQQCENERSGVLRVLDVGSCYAPFQGKCVRGGGGGLWKDHCQDGGDDIEVPLDVTSIDLQPAANSPVLKCDWLQVPILLGPSPATKSGVAAFPTGSNLVTFAHGHFDAIIFSLLLSYMPTAPMRYLACIQAHRALKADGLLVMVNTRTQGSRQSNWEAKWVEAIEAIGFQRVHKDILHNLVGMSFRRVGDTGRSEKEDEEWARALLTGPYANSLAVSADAEP